MFKISLKGNSEKLKIRNHGIVQLNSLPIPSLKFLFKLVFLITRGLWRSFFFCFIVFGTILLLYISKKKLDVLQNEHYDESFVNIHSTNSYSFNSLDQLMKNEEKNTFDPNIVQDNEKIIEKIISENHTVTNSLSRTENRTSKIVQAKNYPNYYEDNLRSGWKFQISKTYPSHLLRQWTEAIGSLNEPHVSGPGENGTAFRASREHAAIIKKLRKEHEFNLFASDKISLHRTLPDYRFPECKNLLYPEKLPTTSVIIVFHNEAWSTLLRTVWSVIDRAPRELIEEIILVDDASTWNFLKKPLDDYTEILPARVKIIRTAKREGLIRARLLGAKDAVGSVLTYLDAHMECANGWLEPILARIASDRSVVAVPILDTIRSNDMGYINNISNNKQFKLTGLRWHLLFYWLPIPQRELLRTKNDITAPIRTPSHVGCAFSIDREFFFEIGSYDEGMDIWGSENVELALRVWLCGGSLEIIPCSRVAHLYRKSTYSFNGDRNQISTKNNNRVIEVWLDEFKSIFYLANPATRKISPGNITERINLKNRLQCKNFRWYLENIYPEMNWLLEFVMMGTIVHDVEHKCLDIYTTSLHEKLILYGCHGLGGNQFFAFAKSGQIFTVEQLCLGIRNKIVILVDCSENDSSQLWRYDDKQRWIVHEETNLCVRNNQTDVILDACNLSDARFRWNFIPAEQNKQ